MLHQRCIDGKQVYGKMMHIICQENAIQKNGEIHSTPTGMSQDQYTDNSELERGCGEQSG